MKKKHLQEENTELHKRIAIMEKQAMDRLLDRGNASSDHRRAIRSLIELGFIPEEYLCESTFWGYDMARVNADATAVRDAKEVSRGQTLIDKGYTRQ